ncbi:MAG: hypothetical protein C4297_03790 [Gemmataceae bacterium]
MTQFVLFRIYCTSSVEIVFGCDCELPASSLRITQQTSTRRVFHTVSKGCTEYFAMSRVITAGIILNALGILAWATLGSAEESVPCRFRQAPNGAQATFTERMQVTPPRPLKTGGLNGVVMDHTANHGADRRVYAPSLQSKRDLYVYLPPGYDPHRRYPLLIFLHGYMQDEQGFLRYVAKPLDEAISRGELPALIAAAPDGSLRGRPGPRDIGSFYIDSCAGNYQSWIVNDVWNFLHENYPILPQREAHIIAGVSMGGFGAYNIAFKHRDRFRIVLGILPALNLRWLDCHGNYFGNFSPYCWAWRNRADNPNEVIGSFFHGLVTITMQEAIYPVFGRGPEGIVKASYENPIEMIDRLGIKPGEFDLFVGYAGQDEFNLDAQAESFIYMCRSRGLEITVWCDPKGRHNISTARRMIAPAKDWLAKKLADQGIRP